LTLLAFRNALSKFPAMERLPATVKTTTVPGALYFEVGVGGGAVSLRDGKVLNYRSFGFLGAAPPPLDKRLGQDACEDLAQRAMRLIGRPYTYRLSQTQEEGSSLNLWFEAYEDDVNLVGCHVSATVNRDLGEVEGVEVNGPDEGGFPSRSPTIRFDPFGIIAAKTTVASFAFVESKGAVTALDSTEEPEKGLWLAGRTSPGDSKVSPPGPTQSQLAAAARGEGTPVWIVSLKGDALPFKGETASFPLVKAYVDAQTGRLLWFDYMDQYGFGGGSPTAEPRPAPVLSGPAALTVAGKLRQVRLTPVAATRPFVPSGRAVLGIGKRLFDAEYDAKAGLVRYKGKLARTLLTLP